MDRMHQQRVERLRRIEQLLPKPGTAAEHCLSGQEILAILGDDATGVSNNAGARERKLQRDLEALVNNGRVEAVDPSAKPRRYRRSSDGLEDDTLIWAYTLQQIRDLVAEAIPNRRLDRLWQRIIHEFDIPVLDENRLRVVPDTIRLTPPVVDAAILQGIIISLAEKQALRAVYRNVSGELSTPLLHPQAIVQRGPLTYLVAMKNAETTIRLYAVHRFVSTEPDPDSPLRVATDFDLDEAIAIGRVDFGHGKIIDLELRVRGYLTTLLQDCALGTDQRIEPEEDGSPFDLRLRTRIPQTGQLLRWLLGAGPNVEVLAPIKLRHIVAQQAMRTATLYPAPEN